MKKKLKILRMIVSLSFLFGIAVCCNNSRISSLEKYRELRSEKLNEPRSVIHNNDGCDALYFPIDKEYSAQNFLDIRTSNLIGTGVKTISYCTIASGFGNFTHRTEVGDVLLKHGYEFGINEETRNITSEMIDNGTDPLQVHVEFARENGFEIFWSNRMNDTHDASHRKDKPYFLWSKFKENNPQYLFGDIGERLPNGRWSSVDFTHQEIRNLCIKFYEEVCNNYNVDGVELDFLRHFELFETVGRGGVASKEQRDMLTDMVYQIRKVTEEAGMKRGNPILVLTRIPTSVEYAKKAGIDIERWIEEGLVDIVVGSCYFRLDYWENFAKLGNNKDVKMYAGLSESRVKEEHPLLKRQQNSVYRARAAAAWEAGLDGIYSFNEYDTRSKYLSQIGNPEILKTTNNLYFVTYRDYTADRYLAGGNDYFNTPRLSPTPGNQRSFVDTPLNFNIELGNESYDANVSILLYAEGIKSEDLVVKINDTFATFKNATAEGLFIFEVDQKTIQPGINRLFIDKKGVKSNHQKLKDAAVFFCREKNDPEMKGLINTLNIRY
ncbi:hypothetical protein [Petrimonas sp.]|uniref:hypothetical protein n=1 Tax=Petrimonas sp. TaxID=2023866 RepID=UPI002FC9859B